MEGERLCLLLGEGLWLMLRDTLPRGLHDDEVDSEGVGLQVCVGVWLLLWLTDGVRLPEAEGGGRLSEEEPL